MHEPWGWRDAELRRMWANGSPASEIALVVGKDAAAVLRRRHTLKLETRRTVARRPRDADWTPEEDVKLRRIWRSRKPRKVLAAEIGRTESAICNRAAALGLPTRKVRGERAAATRVYLAEEPRRELHKRARQYGTSVSSYAQAILEHFLRGGFALPDRLGELATHGPVRRRAAALADGGMGREAIRRALLNSGIDHKNVENSIKWIEAQGHPLPP